MIAILIGLLLFVLRILGCVLLIYCVLGFVMPQSDLYRNLCRYVEPISDPVRRFLFRLFPVLERMTVDVAPVALWLAIEIATSLLTFLRNLLR